MDQTQLTTFGNHIRANQDATVVAALTVGNLGDIRDWYSAESATYVWKPSLSVQEMRDEAFDWVEVVALGTNPLLALQVLLNQDTVNPSKASVRGAFASIFGGPQYVNTRTALTAIAKRLATQLESVFAAGPGSEVAPATLVVQGTPSTADVDLALELTAPE